MPSDNEWIFTPAHSPSPSSAQLPRSCPAPSQFLLNWEGWRLLNLVNHESHAGKIRKKWTSSRTLQIKSIFIDHPPPLYPVVRCTVHNLPICIHVSGKWLPPPAKYAWTSQHGLIWIKPSTVHTLTPTQAQCLQYSLSSVRVQGSTGLGPDNFRSQFFSFRLLIMRVPRKSWCQCKAVLWIHDIFVWIRIRIRGSMPLTNSSLTFKTPTKN
jgi:hypothetical protein